MYTVQILRINHGDGNERIKKKGLSNWFQICFKFVSNSFQIGQIDQIDQIGQRQSYRKKLFIDH